ncbi:drug/metabolite transporter (DMT)-like permease [Pseudomonas duriflava]|uniref:Drug/metabolite transporter (DMT)-like permease n=1 Tax=Pseudomonas duriflava TaxID=459528 RepID=A0A562QFQ4_9PSED|nr:drug/metabolite exporter YedA [Pseudomonas duriflava]TWI55574.1 drug/metabolite transporter (DMT)-like permease [Pseudomonas duriflava]
MLSESRRSLFLLVCAFFALYVIWGSTYLVIRIGVESWPPMLMAGLRFIIAGILMFVWQIARGAPLPTGREWLAGGAVGFLLLSCGNGGVTLAEHWGVASGVAALAIATVPLFTLCFGLFWGHPASRLEWAGIGLGLVGILLLNLGDNMRTSPAGALLILFAAASWAFGSVWSRRLPLPAGPMASAVEMIVGGCILLLGSRLSGEPLSLPASSSGWLVLAYLVLLGSIVAFSAYMYLLKHVRPAAATSYAYVNPVVAVLLGILFAGETIGQEEWLAMLVIVAAVLLVNLPQWGFGKSKVAVAEQA